MTTVASSLSVIGRKIFPFRLPIGIAIAIVAANWIHPDPFLAPQHRSTHAAALLVIAAGLALRAWGAGSAGTHTRAARIEAPRLATSGPFAHVRNPIYLGSMLLGAGMSLLIGEPLAFVFAGAAFALLYFGIVPAEEEFLRGEFGGEYRRYCDAVPRFVPRLTPWSGRTPRDFDWKAVLGELWILAVVALIYAGLLFKESRGW